jgi:hypothetical protein
MAFTRKRDVRRILPIAVVVLAAFAARTTPAAQAPVVVSCDSAAMFSEPPKPTAADRVVLGKIALPQQDLPEVEHIGGRWPYARKAGLLVRSGTDGVAVAVPRAWRTRVAIEWGDSGIVSALRIAPCSRPANRWNLYTGGFHLRRPACVPLLARVGGRERRVFFAIGRHC